MFAFTVGASTICSKIPVNMEEDDHFHWSQTKGSRHYKSPNPLKPCQMETFQKRPQLSQNTSDIHKASHNYKAHFVTI